MTEVQTQQRSWRPQLSAREIGVGIGLILGVNLIGASPSVLVGSETDWFDKPWFFPPEILFPIVWTILFSLMGVVLFLLWRAGLHRRDVQLALSVFAVQLGLNLAWTPTFFGLQRPGLGLVVIGLLWLAIVATIVAVSRVTRLGALLLLPYLAWVSFAAVLNYAIYAG